MVFAVLAILLALLVFGTLILAGYAVLHDYPLWQVVGGLTVSAILFVVAGLALVHS